MRLGQNTKIVAIVILATACGFAGTLIYLRYPGDTVIETRVNIVDRSVMDDIHDYCVDLTAYRQLLTEFNTGVGVNYAVYLVKQELAETILGESLVCMNGTGKIFYNTGTGFYFIFALDTGGELEFYMPYTPFDASLFDIETVLNDILEVAV